MYYLLVSWDVFCRILSRHFRAFSNVPIYNIQMSAEIICQICCLNQQQERSSALLSGILMVKYPH